MRKALTIATASLLCALPLAATAQPEAGDRSFTISGTGSSDESFDGSSFGVSLELGKYTTDRLLWGVRQSFNGLVGEEVNDNWSGSTRGFVDYHFLDDDFRPYVGANLGGVYGENVKNTGLAGLETGFRYYALDSTFINFGMEYAFLFSGSDDIDNAYDDGAFFYTLGIGYNF